MRWLVRAAKHESTRLVAVLASAGEKAADNWIALSEQELSAKTQIRWYVDERAA
jgi:hypothetical protein